MFNDNPWNKKEEMKKKAFSHYQKMEREYKEDIECSVNNTQVYDVKTEMLLKADRKCNTKPCQIHLKDMTTSQAIFEVRNKDKLSRVAVLNFASYKNPGGMFLKGSIAQEEALCHDSTLYNVLLHFDKTYYAWNRKNLNRAMYEHRALYTEDIVFFNDNGPYLVDVLTCAAPNYGAASKYQNVTEEENKKILRERIEFLFQVAITEGVDILILGAWGAGVFKQSPTLVASEFLRAIQKYQYSFTDIIFTVPKSRNKNFEAFASVLKDTEGGNEMLKVVVAGPRDYENEDLVRNILNAVLSLYSDEDEIEIVEGGAKGVDRIAKNYALSQQSSKISLKEFPADWNQYGKRAGPLRNQEMAKYGDVLIAFRYKDNPSRGTENMIKTAMEEGLDVYIYHVERE